MARLRSLAASLGIEPEHPEKSSWLGFAALLGAAALFGFGVLLWIAANWDDFGRFGRFGLIGGVIAASSLAAAIRPSLRVPGSLVALLGTGGLMALIGQTYQSGADPWQLFALWAVLTLPLAIAARHDAVWVPWTTVVFTAIPLWGIAQTGSSWLPAPSVVFPMWLAAIGLTVLLSPQAALARWIGETKWSFRLAVFSTLGLIASAAIPAVFATRTLGSSGIIVFWAGLALTGLTVMAFARTKPLEIGLLAATALTIDVLLIAGVVRLLLNGNLRDPSGAFLLTGLLSAGIVAGTAIALLNLIKSQAAANAGPTLRHAPDRTWPVTVLSGIGALLAAIPLVAFYSLWFGIFLQHGPGPYLLGLGTLAGALWLLRLTVPLGFGQQFGVIALVVGLIVTGFGLYRDLAPVNASTVMALMAAAAAFATPTGWIRTLLGATAAAFTAVFVSEALAPARYSFDIAGFRIAWTLIAAVGAGLLWLLTNPIADTGLQQSYEPRAPRSTPFLSGWIAAGLIGLIVAAGPTFLLGGGFGLGGGTGLGTPTGLVWLWTLNRVLSVAAAIVACALFSANRPDVRTPIGAAIGLVLIVLSAVAPGLGATLAVAAVCLQAQRLPLAAFAAFAGLWIMGSFYYWLGWPLIQKAYLLMALGGGLAAVCLASHIRWPSMTFAAAPGRTQPVLFAALLIAASAVATAGIAATTIVQKEAVIRNGRQIYIALAPVDPRSLMQGDFMALRFAMPNTRTIPSGTPKAIATIDARGVATVASVSSRDPAPAANQVLIQLKQKNGQWIISTDAWFFKEGTGGKYAGARFGEFRLDASGHAILVGLTDADLRRL